MANKNNTSFPSCTVTITLTPEARNFLAGTTAGVSHFAIYNDLLDNMAIVDTSFSKRGNIVPLLTGQAESSAHSMSERWKLGRKSMVRILSTMDDLGIIRLHTSRLASISDMLSVDKCQTNDGDICYPDFSNLPPDPQSDEHCRTLSHLRTEQQITCLRQQYLKPIRDQVKAWTQMWLLRQKRKHLLPNFLRVRIRMRTQKEVQSRGHRLILEL